MPNKLAIFVEGLTEQEFAIRLITELAGKRGVTFEIHIQNRGSLAFAELRSVAPSDLHVLVANCCTDNQVKSQISDQYNSLQAAGYSLIIGLRDVYPLSHADIPILQANLDVGLPIGALPIHIHLAILEIEAWFLEELTHFERIDPALTLPSLITSGFDYSNIRASDLSNPAEMLDTIYKSVGKRYGKTRKHIQRTVEALSYEQIYVNVIEKSSSLKGFIRSLEFGMFAERGPIESASQ